MQTKHMSAVMAGLLMVLLILILALALICSKTADADDIPAAIPLTTVPQVDEPAPELWRITAYCGCEKCCGRWAAGRMVVTGAAGVELREGVSCAAPLPFGTVLHIDGLGDYTVQDRTSTAYAKKHDGRVVDIYFNDHKAALRFGVRYAKVKI